MKRVLIISSILIMCAITIFGHIVPKEEIVAYLNSQEVREAAGIERASQDEKLSRLLIIEVGEQWFKLSANERREFAKKWHAAWKHAIPNGIVSVIEKKSGEAVVSYRPDGRVELTK
jgi:hypothetical protein